MKQVLIHLTAVTIVLFIFGEVSVGQWSRQHDGMPESHAQAMNGGTVNTDSAILIKRIEHIAAYYNSIAEVDSLQRLFNGVLGLPQWFVPAMRDVVSPANQRFYNTGVYLGNVFLEFITFNLDTLHPPPPTYLPYFNAIAFANEIETTTAILDGRGVQRSDVYSYMFRESNGSVLTLFSNITLSSISNNALLIFFCRSYPKLFDCQSFDFGGLSAITNPDSQHVYFSDCVQSMGGGPLTLSKVTNVVLTSSNYDVHRQTLATLFYPTAESEPGKWNPPAGPSLILQRSLSPMRMAAVHIAVDSLQTAKEFLTANGLGYEEGENALKLHVGANIGTDIVLSEIVTSVDDRVNEVPDEYILSQNHPNPFNPSTVISYHIPVISNHLPAGQAGSSVVSLKVYDLLGREVAVLVNEEKAPGSYTVTWDATGLTSGVYFYRMTAGEYLATKRLILMK